MIGIVKKDGTSVSLVQDYCHLFTINKYIMIKLDVTEEEFVLIHCIRNDGILNNSRTLTNVVDYNKQYTSILLDPDDSKVMEYMEKNYFNGDDIMEIRLKLIDAMG